MLEDTNSLDGAQVMMWNVVAQLVSALTTDLEVPGLISEWVMSRKMVSKHALFNIICRDDINKCADLQIEAFNGGPLCRLNLDSYSNPTCLHLRIACIFYALGLKNTLYLLTSPDYGH